MGGMVYARVNFVTYHVTKFEIIMLKFVVTLHHGFLTWPKQKPQRP